MRPKTDYAPLKITQQTNPYSLAWLITLWALAGVVGASLFIHAYSLGRSGDGNSSYNSFFVGVAVLAATFGASVFFARSEVERCALLTACSTASCIAHVLRSPNRPYMHDEFGHYYTITGMLQGRGIFEPNQIVTQSKNYPGFETMIYSLHALTGIAPYRLGFIIIIICHISVALCVYSIARMTIGDRLAVFAAILYIFSPQSIFVDQLFAYESLGLPLFIAAITSCCYAYNASRRNHRLALVGVAVFVTAVNVSVHHLSSFTAIFLLLLFSVYWIVRERRTPSLPAVVLLGSSILLGCFAYVWNVIQHARIAYYLGIYVLNGADALKQRLIGGQSVVSRNGQAVANSRTPLSSANYPLYETLATYATQIVLLALVIVALVSNRRRADPAWLLSVVLTFIYYATFPLLFTSGANAAHRSWAFTYVGLSVVATSAVPAVIRFVAKHVTKGYRSFLVRRGLLFVTCISATASCIFTVGSYGAGVNYIEEMPGPYMVGTDGRSTPDSLYDVAAWLRGRHGPTPLVLADARSSYLLEGMAHVLGNIDLAGLLSQGRHITRYSQHLARDAASEVPTYLILNQALTQQPSYEGYYFDSDIITPQPLPDRWLAKFNGVKWLKVVHKSGMFTVLQVRA